MGALEWREDDAEIPDALFHRAKSAAAERGIPLREFVTETVREKIEAHQKAAEKPWVKLAGGLKHLHVQTQRITRIIAEDFEQSSQRTGFDP